MDKLNTYLITATIYKDVYIEATNETEAKEKAEKVVNNELAEFDGTYKIANIE